MTAEPIDAAQALQWNLVTKVVAHDALMAEAEVVARQILRNSQRCAAPRRRSST
jgi:enoyl-CoA hydratase/carnithine racemase